MMNLSPPLTPHPSRDTRPGTPEPGYCHDRAAVEEVMA